MLTPSSATFSAKEAKSDFGASTITAASNVGSTTEPGVATIAGRTRARNTLRVGSVMSIIGRSTESGIAARAPGGIFNVTGRRRGRKFTSVSWSGVGSIRLRGALVGRPLKIVIYFGPGVPSTVGVNVPGSAVIGDGGRLGRAADCVDALLTGGLDRFACDNLVN